MRTGTESTMTSAFETLSASLRTVLTESGFDLGRITSKYSGGRKTSYANRQGEVIGPERLREIYANANSIEQEITRAKSARVQIPDRLSSELKDILRKALADYINPGKDCVGHAFPMGGDRGGYAKAFPPGVYTHAEVSSIDHFSANITKWAAVLGVNAVTDLLAAWTRGEPLAYRTCAVVGVTLSQSIRPTEGILITPLPLSTAELPPGLPKRNDVRRSAYLGHAVLSVDTFATPALFRPVAKYHTVRGKLSRDVSFDLICQALSLECDACIETGVGWNDYGEFSALTNDSTTWGSPQQHGDPVGWRSTKVSPSQGLTTIELSDGADQTPSEEAINDLLEALKSADPRTRVAVTRWRKSMKRGASLTEGFIDLRIALESLFLPQIPDQQMAFRLAANGAWLVGDDGADRRKVWQILRDAYKAGSRAVHRGEVTQNNNNKELLKNAQRVCRRGILRVLRDGPVSDWDGLVLDAPPQGPA